MSKGTTESPEIATSTTLSALPRTVEGATTLIRKLGYVGAEAHAVELDRIAAVSTDGNAFTLVFVFEQDETVRVIELDGWPVD